MLPSYKTEKCLDRMFSKVSLDSTPLLGMSCTSLIILTQRLHSSEDLKHITVSKNFYKKGLNLKKNVDIPMVKYHFSFEKETSYLFWAVMPPFAVPIKELCISSPEPFWEISPL